MHVYVKHQGVLMKFQAEGCKDYKEARQLVAELFPDEAGRKQISAILAVIDGGKK